MYRQLSSGIFSNSRHRDNGYHLRRQYRPDSPALIGGLQRQTWHQPCSSSHSRFISHLWHHSRLISNRCNRDHRRRRHNKQYRHSNHDNRHRPINRRYHSSRINKYDRGLHRRQANQHQHRRKCNMMDDRGVNMYVIVVLLSSPWIYVIVGYRHLYMFNAE